MLQVLCVAEKPSMAKELANLLSGGHFSSQAGRNKFCKNFLFSYRFADPADSVMLMDLRLGQGTTVNVTMTSVLGHLTETDFDESYQNWNAVLPAALFDAPLTSRVIGKGTTSEGVAANLGFQARSAQVLVIWTDCDREGEYIGGEVEKVCLQEANHLQVYRAQYSVLDGREVHRAMAQLRRLDRRQIAAVETRMRLDLITGAAFTRLQTMAIQRILQAAFADTIGPKRPVKAVISYGSCQFPTLGFIVEQYQRLIAFTPQPFWSLEVRIGGRGNTAVASTVFNWDRGRLFDRLITFAILQYCSQQAGLFLVERVERWPTSKWRPVPLRTVEFQKAASRWLRIPSDQLMKTAEALYNKGFISYPRTETDQFDASVDFRSLIGLQTSHPKWKDYAQRLLLAFRVPRKGKNNDKAHPPIHPTREGVGLEGAEARVYEFVVRRFLACCSDDAKGSETLVQGRISHEASSGGEVFRAKGLEVHERNYLEIYPYEDWKGQEIGQFTVGEVIPVELVLEDANQVSAGIAWLEMKSGMTSPPRLLSESELIGTMDKNGIGTDATIHDHIRKIIDRGYVVKGAGEGLFRPTLLGLALVEGYDEIGLEASLTKPQLRAMMERDLKAICEGTRESADVLVTEKELFRRAFDCVSQRLNVLLAAIQRHCTSSPFDPAPLPLGQNNSTHTRRRNIQTADADNDEDDENDSRNIRNTSTRRKRNQPIQKQTINVDANNTGHQARNNFNPAPSPSSSSTVLCGCGQAAVTRKVAKAGPNIGREFYSCSKGNGGCGFFLWNESGDQNHHLSNMTTSEIRCQCGLIAVKDSIKSGSNAGKTYLRCSKQVKRCVFFQYTDDAMVQAPSSGTTSFSCFKCGQAGHFATHCPSSTNSRGRGSRGRGRRKASTTSE